MLLLYIVGGEQIHHAKFDHYRNGQLYPQLECAQ